MRLDYGVQIKEHSIGEYIDVREVAFYGMFRILIAIRIIHRSWGFS